MTKTLTQKAAWYILTKQSESFLNVVSLANPNQLQGMATVVFGYMVRDL